MRAWRTFGPHSAPVAEQRFVGAVRQIIGGRRWSLCVITRIESDRARRQDRSVDLTATEDVRP